MSAMKPIPLSSSIKIFYKALPRSQVLWPILDIGLSYKNKTFPQKILSLVDSGASVSILHPQLADYLGFDLKKLGPPKAGGLSVSGNYKSWALPNSINVDIHGYTFSFNFTVIDNPNLIWACILGEDSIFSVAKIDFQKFKKFFEIRFRQDLN